MDFDPFGEIAAQQEHLLRQALSLNTREVEAILRSRSTDSRRIEHQLDRMLGFCFDADMLLLFRKLCRYYFRIDPAATAFYIQTYREMWDEQ